MVSYKKNIQRLTMVTVLGVSLTGCIQDTSDLDSYFEESFDGLPF